MTRTRRLLTLFIVLSCATAAAAPKATPEFAPTPYTAEQIRDATHLGRTYEFKREVAGRPPATRTMTFVRVSLLDADVKSTTRDEAGKDLEPAETSTSTWEEFRKHAEFPKAVVTITEETVTVPAGKFDCVVYSVAGEGTVTRFFFAKSMPGAPVLFYTEKGATRLMTSTLVRYSAGG
jgi:hypothetical protein